MWIEVQLKTKKERIGVWSFHKAGEVGLLATDTGETSALRRTPAGIPNMLINCGLDDRLRKQQERTH